MQLLKRLCETPGVSGIERGPVPARLSVDGRARPRAARPAAGP